MAVGSFDSFLEELGPLLGTSDLKPDEHNSCLLKTMTGVSIQLELDRGQENLIIGIMVADVPPGAFRERIFRNSMIINGMPPPRYGTFAYSRQAEKLLLFEMLPVRDLKAGEVAALLEMMMPKARMWTKSIERGELPTAAADGSTNEGGGIFGLKT